MISATGQMLYAKHDMAAAIAAKLAQTEGVEYEVLKETKGFRVKPKTKIDLNPLTAALTTLKAGVVADKKPASNFMVQSMNAEIMMAEAAPKIAAMAKQLSDLTPGVVATLSKVKDDVYVITCELRKETTTMLQVMIDGKPRAFGKKELIDFETEWHTEKQVKLCAMRMDEAHAKKWKLLAKTS